MNNFHKSGFDEMQVNRAMWVTLAFIGTVVLAGFSIKTGNPLLMSGFVALPFALMLMYRPDIAFLIVFVLDATDMQIPGVSYTTLGLVAKVVLIATFLLAFLMRAGSRSKNGFAEALPLKWLVAIIIILMAMRGTGLRMLGSATWGGMVYIVLLAGIAFYFAVQNVQLTAKQIRWLLWGMLLAGIAGSLFSRAGWVVSSESAAEATRSRLMWLRPFVLAAFPLVFALRLHFWMRMLLWLAILGLMGLTGFRSMLVGLVSITAIYGFFRTSNRFRYALVVMVAGLALWGGVIVASPYMPLGLQRSISFVPGTQVDPSIQQNALGSVEWRVEIWKYCLERAPQYLLLGRGSAFNVMETAGGLGVHDISTYSPWFAYETRSYHSGPLALLIDYGIPGLVVVTWLMVLLFRRFWRYAVILGRNDSLEARFTLYWCAYMLWHIVAFYLVYGSMVNIANRILAVSALILVLFKSVEILAQKKENVAGQAVQTRFDGAS